MNVCDRIVLLVAVFICAIPAKRGNMMRNDVTPYPPTAPLSSIVGTMDKNCVQISDEKDSSKSSFTEQSTEEVVINQKKKISPAKKRKKRQSVCLYGFPDIFLFQSSAISNVKYSSKNTILTTPEAHPGKSEPAENVEISSTPAPTVQKDAEMDVVEEKVVSDNKNEIEETEVPTTPTPKKADSEIEDAKEINLEIDSMQSFEEWKSLKRQQQEEMKAEFVEPPLHVIRAKKTQVNYASQDCGAKILGHNPEAKHVSAILDENKDLYMLNPCSTSIWFVIELCEPIQVQQIQLGNLELFSSAPKDFSVSVSERYPAREWHNIGTFHANNERLLQTFVPRSEEQMFAKYIKFEMLSHFSHEHFCPLTLVRVLGVSMVDELDESENGNTKEEINVEAKVEGKVQPQENEGENGPINTMINMVKNAVDHVLKGPDAVSADENGKEHNHDNESFDPTVESEVILVLNDTEVANSNDNNNSDIFITLIETGNGEDLEVPGYFQNLTFYSHQNISLYMPKFIQLFNPISKALKADMCWFLEFFCKVSLAGCLVHYPYNYSAIGVFLNFSGSTSIPFGNFSYVNNVNKSIHHSIEETPLRNESAVEQVADLISRDINAVVSQESEEYNSVKNLSPVSENSSTLPINETSLVQNNNLTDFILVDDANASKHQEDSVTEDPPAPPRAESNPPDSRDNEKIDQDSNLSKETADKTADSAKENVIRDTEKTSANSQESSQNQESDLKTDTPYTESKNDEEKINDIKLTESESNVNATADDKNVDINVNSTQESDEIVSEHANNHQSTIVINPGTNQKDSVFMRLNNRIRALEQNMSLSSDYLETLSQRYKKQMDEMQRAFNQTTFKLLSTSKTAKENDAKQTDLIQIAQEEIRLLKEQLKNLSISHEQLTLQLVERHIYLIFLEIMIFSAVFVTCLGRRMSKLQSHTEKAERVMEDLQKIYKFKQCIRVPPEKHSTLNGKKGSPTKSRKVTQARMQRIGKKISSKHAGDHDFKSVKSSKDKMRSSGRDCHTCSHCKTKGQQRNVEVIDKDPRWIITNHEVKGIGLKIPNGHSKGRR